jgi:hypothetical protein
MSVYIDWKKRCQSCFKKNGVDMKEFLKKYITLLSWGLSVFVVLLVFVGWADNLSWNFRGLSNYQLFPIFGLVGFSLMWGHYVTGAARSLAGIKNVEVHKSYFKVTSWIVLASILIHPTLLIYQLWRDGSGLPPESYKAYVGEAMVPFVFLGTVSLFAFLLFELRHKFGKKSWWKYVLYANAAAMWGIYVHALQLGGTLLTQGWLRTVWYIMGIMFFGSLVVIYSPKTLKKLNSSK